MAESKVKRENFITIQGFMLTDLKLKGNELLIYACIYGFSQAENQVFNGSLQYLADWTNSTKQGVIKCLKSLEEKQFIVKKENYINGVKFCEYYATKFNTPINNVDGGIQQSLTGGVQQSLPNSIGFDTDNDNTANKKKGRKVSDNSFDSLIADYLTGEDGKSVRFHNADEIENLLRDWLKVRKAKRAAMTDRAIELNLQKLDNLAIESGLSVADYLKEVICRGWQAFYPINNYNAPASQQGGIMDDFNRMNEIITNGGSLF